MPLTKTPLTWRHAIQYPEDGYRHEVIDGEHVMTPAPTFEHQQIVGRLGFPPGAEAGSWQLPWTGCSPSMTWCSRTS